MSAARLLERLNKVRMTREHDWWARCPAHDDQTPSLHITLSDDGRVLLHCFAGCDPQSILDAVGLRWRDLCPDYNMAAYADAVATASNLLKASKVDPLEMERRIIEIAAADLRAERNLSAEDRARVALARERLGLRGVANG